MKQVVFKVDEDLFIKSKILAVQRGQNMTQYLVELMKSDLERTKKRDTINETNCISGY